MNYKLIILFSICILVFNKCMMQEDQSNSSKDFTKGIFVFFQDTVMLKSMNKKDAIVPNIRILKFFSNKNVIEINERIDISKTDIELKKIYDKLYNEESYLKEKKRKKETWNLVYWMDKDTIRLYDADITKQRLSLKGYFDFNNNLYLYFMVTVRDEDKPSISEQPDKYQIYRF